MKKVIFGQNDLSSTNPSILKEWNYDKNKILPTEISKGSSIKVWWKCSNCSYEWEATPKNRIIGGTGCPKCGLKKIGINHNMAIIKKHGSLYDKRPDLVKEWDYKKNYPLTPKDVSVGSGKKVWWICDKGHSWESSIDNRTGGSKCIYCTKQKTLTGVNDIVTTNPELLKEWDYEKNVDVSPNELMAGSNKKVWWKCQLGHSWKTSVAKRIEGTGCPHCYSEYGTSFPEQAILYYLSKKVSVESRKKIDNQEIDIYLPSYNIGFEYDGMYYHETEKSKQKEEKKNDILKRNNITLYRIKESNKRNYDKNNNIIFCIIDRNYKYLEDIIKTIGNILNITIDDIDIERDQISIYNQYVKSIKDNNFTINHPELLKEWDYDKNKGLMPESLLSGSNKKVWWKCSKCGSSFYKSVNRRIEYSKCPYCSAKKVNDTNSFEKKYPNLIKYWDYDLNKNIIPANIYYSSRKIVWWKCEKCGKSYSMSICSRIKSKTNYCFDCKHKHIGDMNRFNSLNNGNTLFECKPDIAKEWNYKKNYPLTPKNVSIGSGKTAWWICNKCGNEWQAKIYNRVYGTGCPKCYKSRKKLGGSNGKI